MPRPRVNAKPYLASTPWDVLEDINSALCQAGGYQVGRTSDGYASARELWEKSHASPLTFLQAADLCRECHRLAPFLFLNGNPLASCARIALQPAMNELPAAQQTVARAALGHYIAGTIRRDELVATLPAILEFLIMPVPFFSVPFFSVFYEPMH